jgi:hypothetical protein
MTEAAATQAPAATPDAAPTEAPNEVHTQAVPGTEAPATTEQRADLADAKASGDLTAAQFKALAEGGKIKLKVYGKEREVDASEALRLLSINAGSDDAMRSAAAERKKAGEEREQTKREAQQLGQMLRKDPLSVIRRLGLEDAILDQYEREVAYKALPEDQRARHEIETERQRLAREKAEWKAQQDRHAQEQQQKQLHAQAVADARAFNQELAGALDSVNFGKSETKRKRAITYMVERANHFLDNGLEIPPAAELASDAKAYFLEEAREYARSLDPAEAEQEFGPDFMRALRKSDVARIKETQSRAPGGQFATGNVARVEAGEPPAGRVRYSGGMAGWEAARQAKLKGK